MNRILLVLLLLLPPVRAADGEKLPCKIPKGPPCLSISELNRKLEEGHCEFEEGACFTFQWDEYGETFIKKVELQIVPRCDDKDSAARLEQKGRAYIESLQSIPVEVSVTLKECKTKSSLDLRVIETSTTPLSPEPR